MLAAISTTILLRRSCALTGSAITSRSRRNSTRGPPSAPRIAIPQAVDSGPAERPRIGSNVREQSRRSFTVLANAVRRGQDKPASPRIARRDAAAGCTECIRIDDFAINVANGFAILRSGLLRCGRAEQTRRDGGDI